MHRPIFTGHRGELVDIMIAGGKNPLMDALITKFAKEGHRLYVLTEKRFKSAENRKVFEYYYFAYDNDCLNDVLDSVNPDVIIALGAYDACYDWTDSRRESVRYLAGMTNLLLAYSMRKKGRFVYLSSEEVFMNSLAEDITEQARPDPNGARSMALYQVEEMCLKYGGQTGLDTITARIDGLYDIPLNSGEVWHKVGKMSLDAIRTGKITANSKERFSVIFISDAVEHIYRLSVCETHKLPLYNISASTETNGLELAGIICEEIGGVEVVDNAVGFGHRIVLSSAAYDGEFGMNIIYPAERGVRQVADYMKSHKSAFLDNDAEGAGAVGRFMQSAGKLIRALVPFVETLIFFVLFFLLNNMAVGSQYFAKVDFLFLYVIITSLVHGQQQSVFAAFLAMAGYIFRQMYNRSGFDVMLDYSTYVWVAQMFIVGLAIGNLRDRLKILRQEDEQNTEYFKERIDDIGNINFSNSRMKNTLINQLISQEDSIGKIYSIVSALDNYNEYEVLFYAADVVARTMKCPDVAIYTIVNNTTAHLYSSTSHDARKLGNSVEYREMGELSKCISDQKGYLNKNFDSTCPLMARAIYQEDKPEIIIMLWGLKWDQMTLSQENMLTVVSYLIQNATLKANKYLNVVRNERYLPGTDIMMEDAFKALVHAHINARGKGLTECTAVCFDIDETDSGTAVSIMKENILPTDYIGMFSGSLSVLFCNGGDEAAENVMVKLLENGIVCNMYKPKLQRV